jgi:hypothetical protein
MLQYPFKVEGLLTFDAEAYGIDPEASDACLSNYTHSTDYYDLPPVLEKAANDDDD